MTKLGLSFNKFGDERAVFLASCLQNINELYVNDCNITKHGVEHISQAINRRLQPVNA